MGFVEFITGALRRTPLARPVQRELHSPQRLQPRLDRRTARLQKRRQRQTFAECVHRLVGGKAGTVGRDLEQNAVGLAKIKTAEIEAVDLAAVGNAKLGE